MRKSALESKYLVGIDLLDEQHKVILDHLADVHQAIVAGQTDAEMCGLTERLDDYCQVHYQDEEKLLLRHGRERECHIARHAEFLTHLKDFALKYPKLTIAKNIAESLYLKAWFLEHILFCDQTCLRQR